MFPLKVPTDPQDDFTNTGRMMQKKGGGGNKGLVVFLKFQEVL